MGTAPPISQSLQAALAEAIQPYLGAPIKGRRIARDLHVNAQSSGANGGSALVLSERQWRRVGRDVLALHEGYTRRTAAFARQANPIHARAAGYQLYYLPRNWYRVHRVIEALPWNVTAGASVPDPWLTSDGDANTLRLLDLGCGSGAFTLAWLAWLAQQRADAQRPLTLHLTLVDQGHELLELAQANLRAFARRALPGVALDFELHADGVQPFLAAPAGQDYAIAGAAMTLNELALLGPRRASARAELLAGTLRRLLRPGGCLLLVEPGTRRGYMNLMALREHLLELPILYPCPHNATCPMWGGTVEHWCHATERLPAGFFFDEALRRRAGVGFDMLDLELAALAVQTLPGPTPDAPFHPRTGERIVSAPLRPRTRGKPKSPAQGDRVVLACAQDGLLHERPAPSGGPFTRGRWSPAPGGAVP